MLSVIARSCVFHHLHPPRTRIRYRQSNALYSTLQKHTFATYPSSATMNSHLDSLGNFDLIRKVKLGFTDVTVSKWRSRVTGLNVVHLDYEAPIVNGYFVVPTEIFNDSGCPHTLEHLVFLGSEKYPYKGIIDQLANRGFSNGTNAWTDTDHTAYTCSTAGEQGFLQLLPIFVDHILYPTLTEAGFITEVHHIDPQGQDSGVVYSEMQGRENTSGDLMSLRLQRLLDPEGSGYRSETGGLMENIRKLTVEQIREYHSVYYVPHNLNLIVAGKLPSGTDALISMIQEKIEPTLIAHGQNLGPRPPNWKRPFVETASAIRPPIPHKIKDVVEFPEKDESVGELIICWLGPAPNQLLELKALDILSTYLTSSAVAPLNKEYVETESPLCTYIYFSEEVRATRVTLPIYIGSVPTEHLHTFDEKLKSSFERIANEGLDMERMIMVINRAERQLRSKLESSKDDEFSGTLITDFLYGAEDGSEIEPALDEISLYAKLRTWTSQQWSDILRKYYIDGESIVIVGKPSAAMVDRLDQDEKVRIAAQIERLGPEGLKHAAQALAKAKEEHDAQIPSKVLTDFHIPSVKSISWIPVQSAQESGVVSKSSHRTSTDSPLAKHINKDGEALPYFVQYDHVESDFVSVQAFLSMEKLPDRLRPLVSTYLSAFFALPVERSSGELLTHEEVINKLDNETVSYEVGLGVGNSFSDTLRIRIKVEVGAYETAVAWLKDLIHGAQFDKERIQVTIAKQQQSLPEMKRDGNTVMSSAWANLLFDITSTSRAGGILPQIEYVPKLVQQLQEDPSKVIADMEEIRKAITDTSGIRFSVTGNVMKLDKPRSTWLKYFNIPQNGILSPVPLAVDTLSAVGKNPVKEAIVFTLPTIETSFATYTTKSIQGFRNPEYPALRVALEVLNASEGFLWRYIRGSGLAYGAYVSTDLEAGLLSFSLYRSSNNIEAFKQATVVVEGLVDGSIALDDTTIDAAKSSIVYGVAKQVSTVGQAAANSFTNQALKGVPQNYSTELLDKYQAVTRQDIIACLRTHFLPLFQPSSSVAVIVTSPGKAEDIAAAMTESGFNVKRQSLEIDPEEMDEDFDGSSDDDSGSESSTSI